MKRLPPAISVAIVWLIVFAAVYSGYVTWRTWPLYRSIKTGQRGWTGHVHRLDRVLGFSPVPGARGTEVVPLGPAVPMRYDRDGFRVPVADGGDVRGAKDAGNTTSASPAASHPLILALGDSYTYGATNIAEDTYPYLVGRWLGGTVRNAGVSGYGLAQMLLLARRLVPQVRPDILLVQYSPWLAPRALSPFAPTYYGRLPVPWFSGQDTLRLEPPVFATKVMDLPIDRYRASRDNVADFLLFLGDVGFPLYLHDDVDMAAYAIRRNIGRLPRPAPDPRQVERLVYGEIGEIARGNGAKVVIVELGDSAMPLTIPPGAFPAGCVIVNAQAALLDSLGGARRDEDSYRRQYGLWRGDPPRLVDIHPNSRAQRIIAAAIVEAMNRGPSHNQNH